MKIIEENFVAKIYSNIYFWYFKHNLVFCYKCLKIRALQRSLNSCSSGWWRRLQQRQLKRQCFWKCLKIVSKFVCQRCLRMLQSGRRFLRWNHFFHFELCRRSVNKNNREQNMGGKRRGKCQNNSVKLSSSTQIKSYKNGILS